MQAGLGAAQAFDLSGAGGELLLLLLIAFCLGALFGRILLAPSALRPAFLSLPLPRRAGADDDLREIPGIGPKVATALSSAGIRSFAQLAQMTPERLHAILEKEGTTATGVRSWPIMAAFLAARHSGRHS